MPRPRLYFDIDEDERFVLRDNQTHQIAHKGTLDQLRDILDQQENNRQRRRKYKCCICRLFRRGRAA